MVASLTFFPTRDTHVLFVNLQHFHGLEEAAFRNIDACKQIAKIVRSSYGPYGEPARTLQSDIVAHSSPCTGMNKMVINHIEKLFVTNDAATVIKELEVRE